MRVKLQTETPAKQGSLLGRTGVLNSRIFSDEKVPARGSSDDVTHNRFTGQP